MMIMLPHSIEFIKFNTARNSCLYCEFRILFLQSRGGVSDEIYMCIYFTAHVVYAPYNALPHTCNINMY
jgi:hypothetical protein